MPTCASAPMRTSSASRSEERRVGKSVDLGGRRIIKKKKHFFAEESWSSNCTRAAPASLIAFNSAEAFCVFFFQAEDGIRDLTVTGVQTCALPIYKLGIREVVVDWQLTAEDQGKAAATLRLLGT